MGARIGPEQGFRWLLNGLPRIATWQTKQLQHGYLRYYLRLVMVVMVMFVGFTLLTQTSMKWRVNGIPTWSAISVYEAGLQALMLVATGYAVTSASRMVAIVSVGVVGLGMTLLFALYSAPDLAMTQFAVETLTVLLFVFVLYRLPLFAKLTSQRGRLRDAAVAVVTGGLMAMLVLVAVQEPHPMHVSNYFANQSWLAANGRNVVNVILVDFRALDTLGEVIVLVVAALGVHALIRPLIRDVNQSEAVDVKQAYWK